MKLDSINGKGRGKSGSKVYFVSHGVQLERAYTSSIHNPNTAAQVSQRSRFKLQSQVSAALEKVLVIPRQRLMSPRNRFVKINNGYFYSNENGAQVSYENLQITAGSLALPAISVNRAAQDGMELELQGDVLNNYDRVVYCIYQKTDEGQLYYIKSVIVSVDDTNGTALVTTTPVTGNIVVYAYGMRDRNAKAKATYNSYQVSSATDLATLFATRKLLAESFIFSQTRGVSLNAASSSNPLPDSGYYRLYVTTIGNGTVSATVGQGQAQDITNKYLDVPTGNTVSLTAATPNNSPYTINWYRNGEQTPFATGREISFQIHGQTDIVVEFLLPGLE